MKCYRTVAATLNICFVMAQKWNNPEKNRLVWSGNVLLLLPPMFFVFLSLRQTCLSAKNHTAHTLPTAPLYKHAIKDKLMVIYGWLIKRWAYSLIFGAPHRFPRAPKHSILSLLITFLSQAKAISDSSCATIANWTLVPCLSGIAAHHPLWLVLIIWRLRHRFRVEIRVGFRFRFGWGDGRCIVLGRVLQK